MIKLVIICGLTFSEAKRLINKLDTDLPTPFRLSIVAKIEDPKLVRFSNLTTRIAGIKICSVTFPRALPYNFCDFVFVREAISERTGGH